MLWLGNFTLLGFVQHLTGLQQTSGTSNLKTHPACVHVFAGLWREDAGAGIESGIHSGVGVSVSAECGEPDVLGAWRGAGHSALSHTHQDQRGVPVSTIISFCSRSSFLSRLESDISINCAKIYLLYLHAGSWTRRLGFQICSSPLVEKEVAHFTDLNLVRYHSASQSVSHRLG
jgi:hypothetical protein